VQKLKRSTASRLFSEVREELDLISYNTSRVAGVSCRKSGRSGRGVKSENWDSLFQNVHISFQEKTPAASSRVEGGGRTRHRFLKSGGKYLRKNEKRRGNRAGKNFSYSKKTNEKARAALARGDCWRSLGGMAPFLRRC